MSIVDPTLGEIAMFGGSFAPRSWAFCNGQLLPIAQNTALFSLLGTIYGGDGRTTFALPDFRSRVPMHFGKGIGLTNRKIGQKGGEEDHVLTIQEIPSHTHRAVVTNPTSGIANIKIPAFDDNGSSPDPSDDSILAKAENVSGTEMNLYSNGVADTTLKPFTAAVSNITGGSVENLNNGGNQWHNNMQPFLVTNYIIALFGTYPSRS